MQTTTLDNPAPLSRATHEFVRRFGTAPTQVARAPGRVNLIGDHTDYSEGFVLPMAIDREVAAAFRPRDDSRVIVYSADVDSVAEFDIGELVARAQGWPEYLRGVAWALAEAGHRLRGWEGVVAGDVPIGAGLSSSAALELAALRAFAAVAPIAWDPVAMARLAQRAENEWVGLSCGIMDQLISATGVAGHAMLIDCRSLDTRAVPIPPAACVVVLDTSVRRQLVDSAYNERRRQCEEAAALLGARTLRDVDEARLMRGATMLSPLTFRRARHVVSENARTLAASNALMRGALGEMGALMDASHLSLRDDFEVSCEALDVMVDLAQRHPACFGARMTGAGFGGCAVALVRRDAVDAFVGDVPAQFERATNLHAAVHVQVFLSAYP